MREHVQRRRRAHAFAFALRRRKQLLQHAAQGCQNDHLCCTVQYAELIRDAARGQSGLAPSTSLAAGPLVPSGSATGNWASTVVTGTLPADWIGSSLPTVDATLSNATLWSPEVMFTSAQSLLVRAREEAAISLAIDQNADSSAVDSYRSYYEATSERVASAGDNPSAERAKVIGATLGTLAGVIVIGARCAAADACACCSCAMARALHHLLCVPALASPARTCASPCRHELARHAHTRSRLTATSVPVQRSSPLRSFSCGASGRATSGARAASLGPPPSRRATAPPLP